MNDATLVAVPHRATDLSEKLDPLTDADLGVLGIRRERLGAGIELHRKESHQTSGDSWVPAPNTWVIPGCCNRAKSWDSCSNLLSADRDVTLCLMTLMATVRRGRSCVAS